MPPGRIGFPRGLGANQMDGYFLISASSILIVALGRARMYVDVGMGYFQSGGFEIGL